MPAKEIKELRQAGKLEEAYAMAKAELDEVYSSLIPDNLEGESLMGSGFWATKKDLIWAERNISWVYYDYLKVNNESQNFEQFVYWLNEIKKLYLPHEEKMLFEQLCWQVGKMAFSLIKSNPQDHNNGIHLFEAIQSFYFPKPSEGYSFLFKALHKSLKDTDYYVQFADWWNFQKAIAEQAYIAYAKQLLPKQTQQGEIVFNKEKAEAFLPVLSQIIEDYPHFQYPAYFNAKLLLALGNKVNILESLLPFAKKKRNDFWVWEILAEAISSDPEKVFACYCKALSCKSPDEMLVSLRQKMARVLISRKLYNEAITEIDLLVYARTEHGYKIPTEVTNWQGMDWYKTAVKSKSNFGFYKAYVPIAEALLFSDVPEESVIVEFVNADKKILNFIASETKFGFLKYDRFFSDVKVGDTLKVRFQGGSNEGMHQLYTAIKVTDDDFKEKFMRDITGFVKILFNKPFGFIEDVFIHPSLIIKYKLSDGMQFSGKAIKSYNQDKKQWGWKLL